MSKKHYDKGFQDSLHCFAWYKDGVQYVGSGIRTLKEALETMESLFTYDPPAEPTQEAASCECVVSSGYMEEKYCRRCGRPAKHPLRSASPQVAHTSGEVIPEEARRLLTDHDYAAQQWAKDHAPLSTCTENEYQAWFGRRVLAALQAHGKENL